MPFETIILLLLIAGMFFALTRINRKATAAQQAKREEALVVGNNVVTSSGFFGRIVDIDGDAVTLESPSGDETVWLRTAIVSVMDIPLAATEEDDLPIDIEEVVNSEEKREEQ